EDLLAVGHHIHEACSLPRPSHRRRHRPRKTPTRRPMQRDGASISAVHRAGERAACRLTWIGTSSIPKSRARVVFTLPDAVATMLPALSSLTESTVQLASASGICASTHALTIAKDAESGARGRLPTTRTPASSASARLLRTLTTRE